MRLSNNGSFRLLLLVGPVLVTGRDDGSPRKTLFLRLFQHLKKIDTRRVDAQLHIPQYDYRQLHA